MGALNLLNHLLNFVLPAVAMGVMMPLFSRLLWRKVSVAKSLKAQMTITSLACLAVLIAGLVVFGNDGKMATYAGVVLAAGLCQWWFQGGWRIK